MPGTPTAAVPTPTTWICRRGARQPCSKYLKDGGVTNTLTSRGYGETDPIASNDTDEGRQQNRRVVLESVELTRLSANDETLLKGLIQQAERAQAAGQREEAQRLLARAESISATHPLVLNARAIDLLQSGNAARARELLDAGHAGGAAQSRRCG